MSTDECIRALQVLCSAKRTVQLTKHQAIVWYEFLAGFAPQTINRAVIELSATAERFPDLSDLLALCRRIERPPEDADVRRTDPKPIYVREVREIAARLGLEIEQP